MKNEFGYVKIGRKVVKCKYPFYFELQIQQP